MTEEDAKTKWCPFVRFIPETEFSQFASNRAESEFNSKQSAQAATRCLASACMAWRWYRTNIRNPDDPTGDMLPSTRTHGYCGLAGHWFDGLKVGDE
jgi:hypothetical protein